MINTKVLNKKYGAPLPSILCPPAPIYGAATSPNPFPLPIRPHHDNDGCDVAPTSTAAVATTKDDGNDDDGENEDEGGRRRRRVSNLSFLTVMILN